MRVVQVRLENDDSNFVAWIEAENPKSVKIGSEIEYNRVQYEVTSIYSISDVNW